MATTDIDGTPLFLLGALEAVTLLDIPPDDCYDVVIDKLKKFLNEPQVVKWLEENS